MTNELHVGATDEVIHVVGNADLASALPLEEGDSFPRVFATSRMVALMEIASARVMARLLKPGQLSVGTAVQVTHTAPTALGAEVKVTARYLSQEGKFFVFEAVAYDEAGEIGRARHKRAIVDVARLEAAAEERLDA